MVLKKRATRATKHINPLPVNGFMRSTSFFCLLRFLLQNAGCVAGQWIWRITKRATFFSASVFSDADNIYHHIFHVCNQQNNSKHIV